jgi:hypothetical protein
LADETADRNKQELNYIVLRYVLDDDNGRFRSPISLENVFKEIKALLTNKFGPTEVELHSTGVNVGQVLLNKTDELVPDKANSNWPEL